MPSPGRHRLQRRIGACHRKARYRLGRLPLRRTGLVPAGRIPKVMNSLHDWIIEHRYFLVPRIWLCSGLQRSNPFILHFQRAPTYRIEYPLGR